jgi:hypothetical protein
MLRDEHALKAALVEELMYEAQLEDLVQLQALYSGDAVHLASSVCIPPVAVTAVLWMEMLK